MWFFVIHIVSLNIIESYLKLSRYISIFIGIILQLSLNVPIYHPKHKFLKGSHLVYIAQEFWHMIINDTGSAAQQSKSSLAIAFKTQRMKNNHIDTVVRLMKL